MLIQGKVKITSNYMIDIILVIIVNRTFGIDWNQGSIFKPLTNSSVWAALNQIVDNTKMVTRSKQKRAILLLKYLMEHYTEHLQAYGSKELNYNHRHKLTLDSKMWCCILQIFYVVRRRFGAINTIHPSFPWCGKKNCHKNKSNICDCAFLRHIWLMIFLMKI